MAGSAGGFFSVSAGSSLIKDWKVFPFSHASAPSLALEVLTLGETVREIVIDIVQAFSLGTTISIGTDSFQNQFVASSEIDATVLGERKFFPYLVVVAPDTMKIFISAGSVTGNGLVYVDM